MAEGDELIAQARATAKELCTAQSGGLEQVANDAARQIADRLAADPNQNLAVLRFLAVAVNSFASASLALIAEHGVEGFAEKRPPSWSPEMLKAQMFMVSEMFDSIDLRSSTDPPPDL